MTKYSEALDLQMQTSSLLRNNRYTQEYTEFMLGERIARDCNAQMVGHNLKNSHTYYVTEEMCDLISWAWPDMPSHPIEPEHLPSPFGWAWLEKPYVVIDVNDQPVSHRGVQWVQARSEDGGGVLVLFYGDHDAMTPEEKANFLEGQSPEQSDKFARYVGRVHVVHSLAWGYGKDWTSPTPEEFTSLIDRDDISHEESLRSHRETLGWLTAFWAITNQELGRPEETVPPRATRRRAEREGKRDTAINVVHMRRRASGEPEGTEHSDGPKRKMTVKTYVRPFWRRQWYPKDQVHRLILIPPHVRGPEDAPWSTKTTVRVVDR